MLMAYTCVSLCLFVLYFDYQNDDMEIAFFIDYIDYYKLFNAVIKFIRLISIKRLKLSENVNIYMWIFALIYCLVTLS
jgi:hypothetical protein